MRNKKLVVSIIVFTALLLVVSILTNGNISTTSVAELGESLGAITIVPTVLAVVLAFVTHNVLFSLLIGFLSGVLILGVVNSNSLLQLPLNLVLALLNSIKDVVLDKDNIEVLLLCFAVGGMIEVVRASGGFEALAIKLANVINSPRKANLVTSILGCLVFFDDYATTLIVGPIMKPITDRVKVSREKLSFIIDSTSAPVSGIALISSWIAVEIISIQKGLEIVGSNTNGFSLFVNSIPFCFYCLFAISFVFINSLIGKDFGPMLKAEQRALRGQTVSEESKKYDEDIQVKHVKKDMNKKIFVSVGSIALLTAFAIISFYIDGKNVAIKNGTLMANAKFSFESFISIISNADTVGLITISALVSAIFAVIIGSGLQLFTLKESTRSWLTGVRKIGDEVIMLVIAWCLASTVRQLGTTYFVAEIISANVSAIFVPVLIFVSCCVISCASGSFGCMFVVMPLAIPLAYRVISIGCGINNEIYLLICVGSVVAGSIFGDHCSPVTDCTILAASGAGCSTMEHCYSQLPYTLVNCAISIICGIILTCLGVNVLVALAIGIICQILVLLIIGKKPTK